MVTTSYCLGELATKEERRLNEISPASSKNARGFCDKTCQKLGEFCFQKENNLNWSIITYFCKGGKQQRYLYVRCTTQSTEEVQLYSEHVDSKFKGVRIFCLFEKQNERNITFQQITYKIEVVFVLGRNGGAVFWNFGSHLQISTMNHFEPLERNLKFWFFHY